ncbi:MAG: stage II sporulation protein M [Chloroflexota bacterium]
MKAFFQRNAIVLSLSTFLYILGFGAGLLVPDIMELSHRQPEYSSVEYARNNLSVAALLMVGFITLGLYTATLLLINGFLTGAAIAANLGQFSLLFIGSALIPHGILEVPGLLLAGAVGLKSAEWCISIFWGRNTPSFPYDCLRGGICAVLLILLAAPIEAHITPWLLLHMK